MAIFCLELKRASKKSVHETIGHLKELMDLVGGEVIVTDDDPLNSRTVVTIKYDEDLIERRLNRKVGRHKAVLKEGDWNTKDIDEFIANKNNRSTSVMLEELERRIKKRGSEAVAKDLGVSRATLFRKLKKARESGSDIVEQSQNIFDTYMK